MTDLLSERQQLSYIAAQAADARLNVELETEGMTLNIGPQHPATHGTLRIIVGHIMPMCLSSVIVRVTLDMAGIILTAAGLGFLGLGAQPPLAEWGAMISSGRQYLLTHWWVATIPGIAILLVSLAFNLLGDALRDILDPRSAKP